MNDLGEFFKMMAEAKKNDPKAKQAKEIKENLKGDLGGLFSQLSELKQADPLYQKNKQLEDRVKESVKSDLGSLFSELASLKNKKQEIIEEHPQLVVEQEQPIVEELLTETLPLDTPIGAVPPEQQLEPQLNPANVMADLDKYLKPTSVEREDSLSIEQRELNDINKKIKFIEQWIGKIQNTGPGSGEVNLRYLDDVDRSTIIDGYFLKYNDSTKKFDFGSPSSTSFNPTDVKAVYAEVKNGDSVTIHKGDPVYLYRATGNKASVILAGNLQESTSAKTLGLAYSDFAPGQTGIIITKGTLTGVDTSAYAEGDTLYLGSTAGSLTNVKPHSPNHLVYIGVVERANQGQGQIYVSPQNGYELEELHNVNIDHLVALADGHVLTWSVADNQWVNAPLPTGFSGSYTDLTNKPTLFSGAYADLTGKPTLFSGSYTDLTNTPTLFSGSYTDLTNKPTIPSLTGYATESYVTTSIDNLINGAPGTLNTLKELADQLAADESAVSSLTTSVAGKVSLTGSYANPSWITSLDYSKITNTPSLFSGSYTDLTNKPTIPSLTGYATESFVNTAITNLIGAAPSALDTLKEIADQLASDESALSSLTTTVAGKVSLTGSYADPTWITSLAYSKLTGAPSLATVATSGSYTDLTDKPTIPSLTGYATETFVTTRGYITSTASLIANSRQVTLDNSGQLVLPLSTQGGITNAGWLTTTNSLVINAAGNLWLFGQDGTLNSPYNVKITTSGVQFPDGSSQTTGWTGTAAAGTLTGTGLNSTVVNSNLQTVGQLENLQISGGASVTNNSATTHYLNFGTVGQLFDDGQFHIHAKTGNVWINSLDSSDIRLGTQYNSGSGSNVYVGKDLISKTAYKARTGWNAALNTEITLDNYRYRITNSGGIFPQVISNIGGQTVNSSWVSVATISGTSITQTGSTGALLPNNSWTSLYTNHGLDSPADMVVTTITDKAHGIVHRVTFIRNDDGANTGYSIFAEKLW